MNPISIPDDWDDNALLTFEQVCTLIQTAQNTVRDWRRRDVGPRWVRIPGCGRMFITVAEARLFVRSATAASRKGRAS